MAEARLCGSCGHACPGMGSKCVYCGAPLTPCNQGRGESAAPQDERQRSLRQPRAEPQWEAVPTSERSLTPPRAFAHRAAEASLVSTVLVFVVGACTAGPASSARIFGGSLLGVVIAQLAMFLFSVTGLILGVLALLGLRRHGTQGLLAPALAAIVINGLLLLLFVTNFLAARRAAL